MLELQNISHGYDLPSGQRREVLRGLDLKLAPGEFHVVLGRSGCGKSTLLRLLAGLEWPTSGVFLGDKPAAGVVFQEPRLMPWLSVANNVGFLINRRLPKKDVAARVNDALAIVGLTDVADVWPNQLSGGMAQRVAIARALISKPQLLLMDEPFGALDAFTRKQMQDELVQIWQATGTTIVFVTHDIEEAVRLGRKISVIDEGRFSLQLELDATYPRDVAALAVNDARQRLFAEFFSRPGTPAPAGS